MAFAWSLGTSATGQHFLVCIFGFYELFVCEGVTRVFSFVASRSAEELLLVLGAGVVALRRREREREREGEHCVGEGVEGRVC